MQKTRSKIIPSSPKITIGSRAEQYWEENGYEDFFKYVRPNLRLPNELNYSSNPDLLRTKFGIAETGFGNWVTLEDRYNYVNSLIIALYDLNKVVNFDYFIGLGRLSMSFGARGVGSALAHYEPSTKIINITRYHRGDELKITRFIATGGMRSIAHEYGHFLDYIGGEYLEPSNIFSLTGGQSISKSRMSCTSTQRLRNITNDILEKIIWKNPTYKDNNLKNDLSNYYKRLVNFMVKKDIQSDYYLRRNELFARWFEAWVSYKLTTMGVDNKLFHFGKYDLPIYPNEGEIKEIDKLFQSFVKEFKAGYFV